MSLLLLFNSSGTTFSDSVPETYTGSDTTSAIATFVATNAESVSTTDTTSALAQFVAATAETVTTLDILSATVVQSVSISESVSTVDSTSDVATDVVSISELFTAIETTDATISTGGTVFNVSISEVILLLDTLTGDSPHGGGRYLAQFARKHIQHDSSNVDKSLYNEDSKQLQVMFKNGKVYNYDDVETSKNKRFIKAKSSGRFLYNNIQGKYPTTKLR